MTEAEALIARAEIEAAASDAARVAGDHITAGACAQIAGDLRAQAASLAATAPVEDEPAPKRRRGAETPVETPAETASSA
jgi:hypothetical protein